jgi:Na+/melibiose symporter-like transporter
MEVDDRKYERAQARLKELKKFYASLSSYLVVNLFLVLVNYLSDWDHKWFYWVAIFWGWGIVAHAFKVFGFLGLFGPDWEQRKIKELMEKDKTDSWQ